LSPWKERKGACAAIEVTRAILDAAAAADPTPLRSLDAIHLATVLSVGDARIEVITYDRRFAEAARANGLIVVQPGRTPL
jgi:predicted nucleic acid-binding protein